MAQKELDCDVDALAIAWVLKSPHSSTTLLGARDVEQLEKCLQSLEVYKKFTPDIEERINKILDNLPQSNERLGSRQTARSPQLRPL